MTLLLLTSLLLLPLLLLSLLLLPITNETPSSSNDSPILLPSLILQLAQRQFFCQREFHSSLPLASSLKYFGYFARGLLSANANSTVHSSPEPIIHFNVTTLLINARPMMSNLPPRSRATQGSCAPGHHSERFLPLI